VHRDAELSESLLILLRGGLLLYIPLGLTLMALLFIHTVWGEGPGQGSVVSAAGLRVRRSGFRI